MLSALHYELPETPEAELKINRKLSEFLESHAPVLRMTGFPYAHSVAPAVTAAQILRPDRQARRRRQQPGPTAPPTRAGRA